MSGVSCRSDLPGAIHSAGAQMPCGLRLLVGDLQVPHRRCPDRRRRIDSAHADERSSRRICLRSADGGLRQYRRQCLRKHLCESAPSVTGPSVPAEGRPARVRRKPAFSQDPGARQILVAADVQDQPRARERPGRGKPLPQTSGASVNIRRRHQVPYPPCRGRHIRSG